VEGVKQLRNMLSAAGSGAGDLWRRRVGPWIEDHWPDAAPFLAEEPAAGANRLLLETRASFGEALELLERKRLVMTLPSRLWENVVRPLLIHEHRVGRCEDAAFDHVAAHPIPLTRWLTSITERDGLDQGQRRQHLRRIVQRLSSTPSGESIPELQQLRDACL
jgi:hypothetical protein